MEMKKDEIIMRDYLDKKLAVLNIVKKTLEWASNDKESLDIDELMKKLEGI